MLDRLLFDHPKDIGETYPEHAGHAFTIGFKLIAAGCACLVHALLPALFVRTASNTVNGIVALMNSRTEPAEKGISSAPTTLTQVS